MKIGVRCAEYCGGTFLIELRLSDDEWSIKSIKPLAVI